MKPYPELANIGHVGRTVYPTEIITSDLDLTIIEAPTMERGIEIVKEKSFVIQNTYTPVVESSIDKRDIPNFKKQALTCAKNRKLRKKKKHSSRKR